MKLFYREMGSGTPVIILHGLFGTSDNWHTVGKKLENDFRVILPDLRNHGQSPHSDEWDYSAMSDDILDLYNQLEITTAHLIGHSMGGKVAMEFAARFPDKVTKLAIIDIAPRFYPPHHQDILAAFNSVDLQQLKSRKQADDQLASMISDAGIRQFLLKNLARKDDGFYWKHNLKVIGEKIGNVGEGFDESIEVDVPGLFIRGEHSDYIMDDDYDLIRDIFPKAKIATIKGAGHWVHAEKPDELLDMLNYFLKA